jgi:alkylation response protein AidB-like acyl-CoA dehydrogenase
VRGRLEDPIVRAVVAGLAVDVLDAEALAHAVVDAMVRGGDAAAEAAANKLAHTEVAQKIARAALDLGGAEMLAAGSTFQHLFCQSTWETIGGGTTEIMRSVVAREVLGLRP